MNVTSFCFLDPIGEVFFSQVQNKSSFKASSLTTKKYEIHSLCFLVVASVVCPSERNPHPGLQYR